jgi:hypothetical protein
MVVALLATLPTVVAAERSVSQGRGTVDAANIFPCPGSRPSPLGHIRSADGKVWPLPADTRAVAGPRAADLYNECSGITPSSAADAQLAPPIIEVDADGEVITAFLLADNYFELYVNGRLVAVDAVPFTPFNSAVVRFRARRPFTYAVKLVDWEENIGLGTESGGGPHHPGDGGFIARFSDGTVTDASWRVQSFYIAPLPAPDAVIERGNVHDSSALGRVYPDAPAQAACGERCYAIHYDVPPDWMQPGFVDDGWPAAQLYSNEQMGIHRQPGYTRFATQFGAARPIWSANLVLDNLVLARKVVR